MLTDFRSVLPPGVARPLGLGKAVAGAGVGGGRCVVDGARSPLLGVLGVVNDFPGDPIPPVLFRVFGIGKAGSADVGGPIEGRDGLGMIPVAIVGHVRFILYKRTLIQKPQCTSLAMSPCKLICQKVGQGSKQLLCCVLRCKLPGSNAL